MYLIIWEYQVKADRVTALKKFTLPMEIGQSSSEKVKAISEQIYYAIQRIRVIT